MTKSPRLPILERAMSFSTAWRDYNTQRGRRYRDVPKLITLGRGFVSEEKACHTLTETTERCRQLKEFGFALIGEQFQAERELGAAVRAFLVRCHHHHALTMQTTFTDLEHELLDAEAHLHALHSIIVGHARKNQQLV